MRKKSTNDVLRKEKGVRGILLLIPQILSYKKNDFVSSGLNKEGVPNGCGFCYEGCVFQSCQAGVKVDRLIAVYTGPHTYDFDGIDVLPVSEFLHSLYQGEIF